jgi:hypothetical protein
MSSTQQLLLGEGAGGSIPVYIEEVFSTYLYTGTGADQTITNGIDLSTKGGMVWIKQRTIPSGTGYHFLYDSARGGGGGPGFAFLNSNTTSANGTNSQTVSTFNSDGFSLGADSGGWGPNRSGSLEVSWTFRKQPKFFDVVTYTGNGSTQTITHALGVAPAVIILKKASASGTDWYYCYDIGASNYRIMYLNSTSASSSRSYLSTDILSAQASTTSFFLGSQPDTNDSGATFVAYLFASNAGGFGLTGTDNVISCGSFSGSVEVNLGYEAQWILFKDPSGGNWYIQDIMRGMSQTQGLGLLPDTAAAESNFGPFIIPTATGFKNVGGGTYIYIAIRRGPMKVPTVGTSVFNVSQWPGNGPGAGVQRTFFPVDSLWANFLTGDSWNTQVIDRLRKASTTSAFLSGGLLSTASTAAESANSGSQAWSNDRFYQSVGSGTIYYAMGRAPSFFDEVCYTGNGSDLYINHNLGVFPQLIIAKSRSATANWTVTFANNSSFSQQFLLGLNLTDASFANVGGQVIPVSSTQIRALDAFGSVTASNANGVTYIAYLFATCAGVSKVDSYTGTGALQTVNCGFTSGARWVMIKRTDSTGAWYVWDSSRGITASDDPYIRLNSTAAQVTNTNYVDTDSTGFKVTAAAPAELNANGGTYLFLAIA